MATLALAIVVFAVRGEDDSDELPLALIALLQVPLWLGLLGSTLLAARRKGSGVVADFGLRMRPRDIPLGLAAGAVTQVILVPLLYVPLLRLLDEDSDAVREEAERLTDRANDPLGVLLLVLLVVVGAPIVEELFFRGLLLRSLERRFGPGWALAGSAVVFGVSHFQLLQLPALVLFGLVAGWLVQRHGRLGPAIWAHVAFNAVTVGVLLAS